MKNIKMLVTDLDNTLLRTDKTISDYTAGILNKCRQNGIKVVFATARPKRTVMHFFEQIPADCLIIHNGAVIYDGDEKIFHCGISPDITKNILQSVSRDFPTATLSVGIDDVLYANFDVSTVWNYTEAKFIDFSDSKQISAGLPDKPAEKIIVGMSPEDELKHFEKYLQDNLYSEITSTDHKLLMIMNRDAKKSNAVKMIADRYGYDISEIAAFGDDYNDVEMLEQCGTGVAVANAIDEAKSAADYICESNDNDGVARWIEENIFNSVKIVKEKIIEKLKEKLEPLSYVYALWLEGSDANGTADEYSDIDLWADIADEYEAEAVEITETALSEIAPFDYKYIMKHDHPQIRQRIYHLEGTGEYLMIDFCWQLHSRDDYAYYEKDTVESVKVIFDKDNIIKYKPLDKSAFIASNIDLLNEMQYRYTQHSRVLKYVRRKQYLEAFAYYQKYVLEPLLCLLRIIYTPAYTDYGYIHISQHIPKDKAEKLEYFAKISSLDDIAKKTAESQEWFKELTYENNIDIYKT